MMKKLLSLLRENGEARELSLYRYFSCLPVLETADLTLRPFRMKDARDVFSYASDPEVARYVLWDPHQSLGETRSYLLSMRSLYRSGLPSSWAIEFRPTGRVIGSIGYMWISRENHSAEIGYSLSKEYWNRGLTTQALSAVITSGFQDLRLHRIEAQHDVRNPASGRVMQKNGMRREGILRSRLINKGEYIDIALWAILREDWEASHSFYSSMNS